MLQQRIRGSRLTTRLAGLAITVATAIVALAPSSAQAGGVRGGLFNSSTLPGNDDGSTGSVAIGFSQDINFFGVDYNALFVNNNGNVTFNAPLSTFTPFGLSTTTTPIIAPFFADVDTRGTINDVTYGGGLVNGRAAFGVNWIDVGYFSQNADKLNSFQLVLIERFDTGAGNFDIEFNYDQIQWETGEASGGNGGLGGSSAAAGYANGTGTFAEILGSNVNGAFLDGGPNSLAAGSNIGDPGTFLFQVRNGVVIPPDPGQVTPVPETSNTIIGFLCLLIVAFYRRRIAVLA